MHPALGKVGESPHVQISQLEVHQLLSVRQQVIYPVGLNGCIQLVTIDLPEPLHSGSSTTTDEHPHLQIDIPLPTPEEPECTTLPGTPIDNIPKTLWKPRITLMAEVNNLINWGMADDYNHKAEHSAMGEEPAAGADVLPPLKAEVPAPPLDTSSQVSVEEMETSQESNSIHVYSPMATGSNCSDSPTIDLTELQSDANLATNHMLSIKRSSDLKSNRWFRILRHHCTSKKPKKQQPMREPKLSAQGRTSTPRWSAPRQSWRLSMTTGWPFRRPEWLGATNSRSRKLPTWRPSVRMLPWSPLSVQYSAGNTWSTCTSRSNEPWIQKTKAAKTFFLTCQAIICHVPLKENLFASYHILVGWLPSSLQSTLFAKTPLAEEQPSATAPPRPEPKQSPWPKRWLSLPDSQEDTSIDETSPMASQEGPSSSKRRETADWLASLKPSHADAFSHDSDLVKEARSHYFSTHPWDWTDGNMDDLSDIFRDLAEGANLLGKSIHELQLSWEGPEELKHVNCSLCSLPKGLKFLRAVPTLESPKIMGLKGIHNADALWHFVVYTYCPWCSKEGHNKGTMVNHIRMVHYRLGIVCNLCYSCPTVMSDTLHQHGHHNCHQ